MEDIDLENLEKFLLVFLQISNGENDGDDFVFIIEKEDVFCPLENIEELQSMKVFYWYFLAYI